MSTYIFCATFSFFLIQLQTVSCIFSCRYIEDVIYITVFVQLMSITSGKFWWTYLVVRYSHDF